MDGQALEATRTHSTAGAEALDYSSRADGPTSNLLKMQFVLLQSTIFDDDDDVEEWSAAEGARAREPTMVIECELGNNLQRGQINCLLFGSLLLLHPSLKKMIEMKAKFWGCLWFFT